MKKVSPTARFEPATYWLQVERSTTELWPLADKSDLSGVFIYFIWVFFIFFGWPRGSRRGLGAYKWCIKAENVVKIKQSTMFTCSSVTLWKTVEKTKICLNFYFRVVKWGVSSRGITLLTPSGSRGAPCFRPIIFQLENRNSPLISFSQLFSRTVTDKQVNKGLLLVESFCFEEKRGNTLLQFL